MGTVGIILAAGLSSRAKSYKLFFEYKGKTFIQSIVEKLLKSSLKKIILVVSKDELMEQFKNYDKKLEVIYNPNPKLGISSSIKLSLDFLEKNIPSYDSFMFFVADQPLLSLETIEEILKNKRADKIIAPRVEDNLYNPVLFHKKFIKEFYKLDGDVGGKKIVNKNKDSLIFVDFKNIKEFMDIDTEEEYFNLIK
ncbi:MAG: nucleotidyltransferase family protein [Fusobacterium sp.]|nr:nucleotidyltransferase family protein [Fusobacterium sp.]